MDDCSSKLRRIYTLKAKLLNRLEENNDNYKSLRARFRKLTKIEEKLNCRESQAYLVYNIYSGWNVSII